MAKTGRKKGRQWERFKKHQKLYIVQKANNIPSRCNPFFYNGGDDGFAYCEDLVGDKFLFPWSLWDIELFSEKT